MAETSRKPFRRIADPFVVDGPSGVSIRDRFKGLTAADEKVLRLVGEHMGRLASADGCLVGAVGRLGHLQHQQPVGLVPPRPTLRLRLSLPIGGKGSRGKPGGYRGKGEWFQKTRRLAVLETRYEQVRAERSSGKVSVVRGGRGLLHQRHNLAAAQKTEAQWRAEWEASRWFLTADGESGKRHGNETIRVTPDGEVSIRLPAPLADLANSKHSPPRDPSGRAQLRHALTHLLRWARATGVRAIAIEDLDFDATSGSGSSSPVSPPADSVPGCCRCVRRPE